MKRTVLCLFLLGIATIVFAYPETSNTLKGVTLAYNTDGQVPLQPHFGFAARNDNDYDVIVNIDLYYEGRSEPVRTWVFVTAGARAEPCVVSAFRGIVRSVRIADVNKSGGLY